MIDPIEAQKVLKWAWIALVVLAIFLSVETLEALKNLRGIDPAYNSVSVSGVGEAVSVPDVAEFSFAVSADAQAVSDAQKQVTEKVDVILAELESLGIEERDIKTTDYSVYPKYVYQSAICTSTFCPPSKQVPDGYTVSHSVRIVVRKTEDAGEALALVGENGATNLSGISFTVDDPDKILNEARAEAIADAKEKAKMLAEELGVRLVRVVSFYDNTGGSPIPYAEGLGGDMVRAVAASAPTVPVGENKVMVIVSVTYEIR
ncbi:MAG: SIMPL domain-containing protein [Candidatus Zambryskibacteria bacterium]|nr:SIMPL domain-containing protein [Candidatus Zambryskibacteria bacterium]